MATCLTRAIRQNQSDFGQGLLQPYKGLYCWTMEKLPAAKQAREEYDQRQPA